MAVREFDGSSDDIVRDIGALSGITYGTVAAFVKPVQTGDFAVFFGLTTSGGTDRASVAFNDSDPDWWLEWFNDDDLDGDESNFASFTNDWWVVVWRKGTGNAVARMSVYDLSTWVHDDLDFNGSTVGEWLSPGAGGVVAFSSIAEGDFFYAGRVAAVAVWSNDLPWAANSSGDSAIEAAGLETAAQNWFDASPDAMWLFNQAAVTTAVDDVTGNGADQTSRTGTTVVNGDDPPGFDFSLDDDEVTATVSHGLMLGHDVAADVIIDATVEHGLVLGHEVDVSVGGVLDVQIAHGLVLGHDLEADVIVDATVEHGLVLGHEMSVSIASDVEIDLSHGLILGHEVSAQIVQATQLRQLRVVILQESEA